MPDVVIVNSGVANLASITSAFSRLGTSVVVTDDPGVVAAARRVVLPGVGAFGAGLAALRARGLDRAIAEAVARGTPLLGVCLGMQMLCEGSEETSAVPGLGLIAGACRRLPDHVRVPHLGWNAVTAVSQAGLVDGNHVLPTLNGKAGAAHLREHRTLRIPFQIDVTVPDPDVFRLLYGAAAVVLLVGGIPQ